MSGAREVLLFMSRERRPVTARDITDACDLEREYVHRICRDLIARELIKRIDGREGPGFKATYALASFKGAMTQPAKSSIRGRSIHRIERPKAGGNSVAKRPRPLVDADFTRRDPCFFCGTRGDIGCRHRGAA